MIITLSIKNTIGFINGFIPKPKKGDSKLLLSWNKNNNIIIYCVKLSLAKYHLVIYANSALKYYQYLFTFDGTYSQEHYFDGTYLKIFSYYMMKL